MAKTTDQQKQLSELFGLSDADACRALMSAAGNVCLALGVTMRSDVQIVDANVRDLDGIHKAIKDTMMVLSHMVVRSGLADRETIQATYESTSQPEGNDNEVLD